MNEREPDRSLTGDEVHDLLFASGEPLEWPAEWIPLGVPDEYVSRTEEMDENGGVTVTTVLAYRPAQPGHVCEERS